MASKIKELSINSLLIDTENPRFDIVSNQREAILTMVEDQKGKLTTLAKDILAEGMNPGDPVYVVRNEVSTRRFDVLEGNRRVTVLKLLQNPNLIPEKYKTLLNSFRKLSNEFSDNPIKGISALVFDSKDEAQHWIELKHTGQNDGKGTVTWDAQQKDRFDERVKGKSSYAIQVIDFISKSDDVDDSIKNKLKEVKSSSLQRLIQDPDYRDVVGIDIRDGKVVTQIDPKEVIKPLVKTIKDLINPDFTVKEIYYKDDRANYLETFKQSELPDKEKKLAGKWLLTSTDPPKKALKKRTTPSGKKEKDRDDVTKRKSIIPKSTIIHINNPRINKIYRELKDLDVKDFENAGAVLLRVFIELSLDEYIAKYPISSLNERSKLKNKLHDVAKDLQSKGIMNKHELKGPYTSASMKDNIISIDTFNAYVHNRLFHPDPVSLRKTWDNLEHFFKKLWELI